MRTKPDQYWDKSWNSLKVKGGGYHCTKCSPGCLNCWAEKYNLRFHNKIPYDNSEVEFVLDEKVLQQPLRRKIPTTYFVCDLCDLFHENVPGEFVFKGIHTTQQAKWHKFLFLTKRVKRMAEFFKVYYSSIKASDKCVPPPNIHLGVTICTQQEADEKIPILLQIPAAHRFLSIEPMLGEVDLSEMLPGHYWYDWEKGCLIKWVVVGCESINGKVGRFRECEGAPWVSLQSPEAEACFEEAAQNIVRQCKAAGVKCFVKQIPINGKEVHDINKFPEDMRERKELC